jgi:transposase-like protein
MPRTECVTRHSYWHWLHIPNIRKAQIAACLDAMINERRFMYTDQFIRR